MTGLRERKKQQTRDALIRAAQELFVSRGYERTTVEEIASAVDVSERTFFRYFAGKEDAVFAVQEMVHESYFARFTARPAHEPPMAALRNALEEGWQGIGETIAEVVPLDLHLRMWQLIETTPALASVQVCRGLAMEERLAVAVAERAGVDPARDPGPQVLVAAFCGVLRAAMHRWGESGDTSVACARRHVREYFDRLPVVLSDDWARAATPLPRPR